MVLVHAGFLILQFFSPLGFLVVPSASPQLELDTALYRSAHVRIGPDETGGDVNLLDPCCILLLYKPIHSCPQVFVFPDVVVEPVDTRIQDDRIDNRCLL